MKVLLICYECSPYLGSEWGVGWGRLLGAAKVADTFVLTSEANFAHLERAQIEGLLPGNVRFFTPEPDDRLRALEGKRKTYAYNYKAYNHWQRLALVLMQRLHQQERFDVVHHVNVCTFREPGYGLELGVPFIWGPTGGSQNYPWRFLSSLPVKEAVKEGLRSVANQLTLRRGRIRAAAQQADLVIAANSTNQRDFQQAFSCPVDLLLETGLHTFEETNRDRFAERIARHMAKQPQQPLQLLWSGELHTRKALPILLNALARLRPEIAWQLRILGDGPMRRTWEQQALELGLADRVQFAGRQTYSEAVRAMHAADLLCFTSLRDTSGNVVLEALAAGVPVICFDHQGCGDIVDASCGVKIPVKSPGEAHAAWAEALEELADTPGRLLELSCGASLRAQHFLWSNNHDKVNQLYRRLAAQGGQASSAEKLDVLQREEQAV